MQKGVLRNFKKSTGKQLCQSLIFNKVAGLRLVISLKNGLWHRCFPVNFGKFLRTAFLQNTPGRLFLNIVDQWTENYCKGKNYLFFEKLCCFFKVKCEAVTKW